jgi:hypothetical protein
MARSEAPVTDEISPERRRRQSELSRWHAEWTARHGFDLDDDAATPEAIAEYERRAREIFGLDPETGSPVGAPPLIHRRRRTGT